MKRNVLLFFAIFVGILLAYNSSKRILSFRNTSRSVSDSESKLEALKKENAKLKAELDYKKSDKFAEEEIRNKLGLAKEGETVVILPQDEQAKSGEVTTGETPNYIKWKELFFGT